MLMNCFAKKSFMSGVAYLFTDTLGETPRLLERVQLAFIPVKKPLLR